MRLVPLIFSVFLALGCGSEDLLGPEPPLSPHFTATINGVPFDGFVEPGGCIGYQVTPSRFVMSIHSPGTWPTPEVSIHLGGITGPGRVTMRPNELQENVRAALYIPGDPAIRQYSAPTASGEVVIDEYDPVQRIVAGRFYFNAHRAVGTDGPEWVQVRLGSFRGTLRAWGAQSCS